MGRHHQGHDVGHGPIRAAVDGPHQSSELALVCLHLGALYSPVIGTQLAETNGGLSVQVTLDVQREGSVSIKGPRGGVFVMYNCARLHTLFDSYERGVEKGEVRAARTRKATRMEAQFWAVFSAGVYPEIPEGSQLDFSALKEEVALWWLCSKCCLRCAEVTAAVL